MKAANELARVRIVQHNPGRMLRSLLHLAPPIDMEMAMCKMFKLPLGSQIVFRSL